MDIPAIVPPAMMAFAMAATAARTGVRRVAPASLESRLADVEQKVAVHEAVCAERYKALNLKLNGIMAAIGLVLALMAGGSPVATAIRAVLGGHTP